jgi:DNA polymerase I
VFTEWAEEVASVGQLVGYVSTVFGWTLRTENVLRTTTLRNFPTQANGAEMLRLACCLATERGIQVCAPIHDAVLIEAATEEIDETVAATRVAMAEASKVVLDGLEVDTDVEIIRWPDRYADPRGAVMWDRITQLCMPTMAPMGAKPRCGRWIRWLGRRRYLDGVDGVDGVDAYKRKVP